MSNFGSFDSRQVCRQAVAWLVLLLTAAGPGAARLPQGGSSGASSGGSGSAAQEPAPAPPAVAAAPSSTAPAAPAAP
ncbi:MAG: hypothetical protein JOZ15_00995, partial [Acidobacteria bacterium]|nr:hypothetical protein [Acidobacteriota bacterium]